MKLSLANIRNGRSAAVALFILIFVSSLLLNIGMMIKSEISTFFDHKVAELHDAHVSVIVSNADYKQSYDDYFRTYPGVNETESEEIILMGTAEFLYGNSRLSMSMALLNEEAGRHISSPQYIEQLDERTSHDIYLPYSFKVNAKYQLGDPFILKFMDVDYNFRIAGFFETTMLGTSNMGIMKVFIPDAAYRQMSDELGEQARGRMISSLVTDMSQSAQLYNDFNIWYANQGEGDASLFWGADIENAKTASMITINLIAVILVTFAIVIVLVSLFVIKFRVTNSIEDGMKNIGVLKAIGYTSWQIFASIVLQFMLITITAGIMGAVLSYGILPLLSAIISSISGLIWKPSFSLAINVLSILIVISLVLIFTCMFASRIRKILPVDALRSGILTHSFRKNFFPLEKSRGTINFLLACKTILANRMHNIIIIIIMAATTFASVFAMILYYNIAVHKTGFLHLIGVETSNVMVLAKSDEDSNMLAAALEQMENVTKVTKVDIINTKIDGKTFNTNVSDDYSQLNNNTIYEGRYPIYDNEISISWLMSKQLNKSIGDTVEVEVGTVSRPYVITGLSQSINNLGLIADLTLSGVQHLIPEFTNKRMNIYIEGDSNESIMNDIKTRLGHLVTYVIDVDETLASQTGVYLAVVFMIMVTILAITALITALILYLVIKTMVLKRKQEFGILKAMGYTTFQIMRQITMIFVPVVIIGVIIGSVLGFTLTNPLLSLLLSNVGVYNARFIMNIPVTIALSLGIIVLSYVISMFVSRGIKRISAYHLITE